ncbi:unnamed protein product [Meganyctiphanes norvegica]|uniref:C2H2-type domain-containing protein n=1 Tax=Meganyctiphanes norvegica TaxID=48144 RepID=A0AAV2PPY3_MEGNR
MSMNMLQAKWGYTSLSQPPTLTCIVPQQDKKIDWQVRHVSMGQPGSSGCQMVPFTVETSREHPLQSHHSRNGALNASHQSQHITKDSLRTPTQIIKKEMISQEERVPVQRKRLEEAGEETEEENSNILNKPSEELVIKEEPLDREQLVEEDDMDGSQDKVEEELMNLASKSSGVIINSRKPSNSMEDDSSSVLYSILAHEASMTDDRNDTTQNGLITTHAPLQDLASSITSIINYKQKLYSNSHHRSIQARINFKGKKCKICNLSFSNLDEFKEHLKIHGGARPYECTICTKQFNFRGNLVSHLKSHSGIKDYSCPLCHRRFGHPADRLSHVVFKVCIRAARHLQKNDEGWICTTCGESKFRGSGQAERHVRAHEIGYIKKCPFCHKEFDNKDRSYTLVRHIKNDHSNHLKDLNFSCDDKRFLELFFTAEDLKSINRNNGFINVQEFENLK